MRIARLRPPARASLQGDLRERADNEDAIHSKRIEALAPPADARNLRRGNRTVPSCENTARQGRIDGIFDLPRGAERGDLVQERSGVKRQEPAKGQIARQFLRRTGPPSFTSALGDAPQLHDEGTLDSESDLRRAFDVDPRPVLA